MNMQGLYLLIGPSSSALEVDCARGLFRCQIEELLQIWSRLPSQILRAQEAEMLMVQIQDVGAIGGFACLAVAQVGKGVKRCDFVVLKGRGEIATVVAIIVERL